MRILPPVEEKIRRHIRDAKARDPLITVSGVQEELQFKLNRTFDRSYLKRLCDKVEREGRVEVDRAQIEERLAFTRENYRLMREELLKIVNWDPFNGKPKPLARDVVEAAKNVVMMDLALLGAEVANGMYRKDETPSEVLARNVPMPDAQRELVLGAFMRWGVLPKEHAEPVAATVLPLPHGNPDASNVAR
jgi:hypothetical protein